MSSCKRKAEDDIAATENGKLKQVADERQGNWCTCCQNPHTKAEAANFKRGADGCWYCPSCWSEWWSLRDDQSVPAVCRVLPTWCERSEQAFASNFPVRSGLSISDFIVSSESIPNAVEIFFKHGFVVLRGVLKPNAIQEVLDACRGVRDATCSADSEGLGNRGRGRYSLHQVTAPGDCLHLSVFVKHLVDNAAVLDAFDAIYAEATRRRRDKGKLAADAATDAQNTSQPYVISGSGGDFCQGWTSEFQPLHSDYGRARPLRPPDWADEDFPVHDKEMPPVITANFIVQPLHRWNGPMRLVPWAEMSEYVDDVWKMENPSIRSNSKSPRFIQDKQTFIWGKHELGHDDLEVAPDLGHEFERRRHWLGYKIFPLEAGDVLIRDTRLWHGGCPNLSSEARFLPAVEVSSKGIVDFFAGRGKTYPPKRLPAEHFKLLSQRAQKLCASLVVEEDDSYLNKGLDDCSWVKWNIGAPAKRNHFMPGLQLHHDQIEAVAFRACLEQMVKDGSLLSAGQATSFKLHLTRLAAGSNVEGATAAPSTSVACSELLALLANRPGSCQHVFADESMPKGLVASSTIDSDVAAKAAAILSSL